MIDGGRIQVKQELFKCELSILSLFAVPYRMSFVVHLLCSIVHALLSLLCSLRSPVSASVRRGAMHFRSGRAIEQQSSK